jgi:hypothetical protein
MRASSSLLASSGVAMGVAAIAIAVMLLASNFAIIKAQPQEVTSESVEIENGTTIPFQSTSDSFSIQVPSGWIIQDVDNAGPAQLDEVRQGYGILMQLCPEEQGAAAPSNASGSTNVISSVNASRCQVAQEVIHVIRYPDLETRLSANNVTANANNNTTTATIDNILTYHMQKLQDVGYRSMRIVNTTDMTSDLVDPQTNETITTVPGKLVEMTYSSNFAPDEMRRGYCILTFTNETIPNVGTTRGYSVFYEGNSTTTTPAEITTAAASLPLPAAVGEVFDSFELIAAPERAQALAEEAENGEEDDNGGDDEEDDNGGDDEEDDNGGDDEEDDNGGDDEEDDNGGDGEGNEGEGNEGEGNEGEGNEGEGNEGNNPNEFEDCEVVGGGDAGDVGC